MIRPHASISASRTPVTLGIGLPASGYLPHNAPGGRYEAPWSSTCRLLSLSSATSLLADLREWPAVRGIRAEQQPADEVGGVVDAGFEVEPGPAGRCGRLADVEDHPPARERAVAGSLVAN